MQIYVYPSNIYIGKYINVFHNHLYNKGYDEDCISPEAADLIKKFLNPDYKERLGAKITQEIKDHPFFKG